MICHQAVSIYFTAQCSFPLAEIIEIIEVIVISGKNYLTVMAALDNVMGNIWQY